jgi:parvulin-like peptidyl-prolyl isomerase
LHGYKLFSIPCFLLSVSMALAQTAATPATPPPPKALAPDAVVLTIGNQKLTVKDIEDIIAALPSQYRPFYSGQGKPQLADFIIASKLLAEEAEKRQLDQKKDVQLKLRIARESILLDAVKTAVENEAVLSDAEVQKYLDEHKDQFEEAKVRRIIIAHKSSLPIGVSPDNLPISEDAQVKANELQKKLARGEDFEAAAAKFSNDMMTSGKGGDLGFIRRQNPLQEQSPKPGQIPITPPVEKVIFSLPVGTVSEVIPSAFGFEIVKVEEKRMIPFAKVRKEVEALTKQQKLEALMKKLREGANVKIEQGYFKP